MLRTHIAFAVASLLAGAAWAAGCGSDTTTETGVTSTGSTTTTSTTASTASGAGGNGGAGGAAMHAGPPGPPANGMPPDGTSDTVLAISHLYLGYTDRDGTPDMANGWKHYGYDLDGKISTKDSTDLCQPYTGALKSGVYPDGDEGTDNAFGKIIVPLIAGIAGGDPDAKINDSITGGSFTIMLDLLKLGAGANYTGVTTRLYGGANLGGAPKFDGTDMWPVVPELLADPETDITKPKVHFDTSYINNNVWVSGSEGDVTLSLSIQGQNLSLTIHKAVISMQLDSDHSKGATNGTLAGILNTEELATTIKNVAGSIEPSLCEGTLVDSILDEIRGASDIMSDGTQNPAKTCDGISIGLGFDAKPVQLGPIAPKAMPGPNPCSMGGAGGAGGGT